MTPHPDCAAHGCRSNPPCAEGECMHESDSSAELADLNGNDRYPPYLCNFVTDLADRLAAAVRQGERYKVALMRATAYLPVGSPQYLAARQALAGKEIKNG